MGGRKGIPEPRAGDVTQIERKLQRRAACLATCKELALLRTVPTEELEVLLDIATFRAFGQHQMIASERDHGSFLYLLLGGTAQMTLHDKQGREVLFGSLGPGDCYGEGALFGNFFRRPGARAETHCYVLQLPLNDLRSLLPTAPVLRKRLQALYMQRMAEFTLARVPLFNHLKPRERLSLTRLLKPQHYPRGNAITCQGCPGDALYLIGSGQVLVQRDGQTIASLSEGDFFGEMSLLSNQPQSATVSTFTHADILVLPAADFHRLLAENPDLTERFQTVIDQRRRETAPDRPDSPHHTLAQVVDDGLLRGSHLLIRTPALCPPGCRICEEACQARHGHLRLHLNGVAYAEQDILATCRQCRIGAECAEACPEDAIEWDERGALFINDRCTGCGECVPACPYAAVARVSRRPPGTGWPWSPGHLLGQIRKLPGLGRLMQPVIPLDATRYTHHADKCDLCHGFPDLACLRQCPTGSLQLLPVEEIIPL